MNTTLLLLAQYETPTPPLSRVAPDYLGLSIEKASRLAAREGLPVPVFRARDSQKAPWLVHVDDLARHLDREREQAMAQWEMLRGRHGES